MKKVLIISYYWPPAGGIGVLRNLKLVKYFREFGWEPVVYVPSNAHYPYLDEGNFKDIPSNLTVLTHSIIEPFTLFKLISGRKKSESINNIVQVKNKKSSFVDTFGIWVRGNFFIPDARAMWIKPSVKYLSKYIKENKIDTIFTDGPPHTNTYIGYKLSKKFNIPWLADFQDPWTQVDYYKDMKISFMANKKHHKMEQNVFKQAKKITIASPTWKEDLESIGAKNVDVLYYGYDEDDFHTLIKIEDKSEFVIVHAGLLGSDRCPDSFLEQLAQFLKENKEYHIQLKLAGQVDYVVKEKIKEVGLDEVTQYLGTIPRADSLQLVVNADLLLLPLNKADNAKGRIPGKLFEYLRSNNQILAFGPEDSDVAGILKSTNRGICVEYEDSKSCISFLKSCLEKTVELPKDKDRINQYSNRELTQKVACWLDEIITQP